MAKRKYGWNEQKYLRYLREGRGTGTLDGYKPWITIHDVPSLGKVSRVWGVTTGRMHHLLSGLELAFFYILDWSEKVLDIREQFPLLDVKEALSIAEEMGIRYPRDPASGFPNVFTTDFLITTNAGLAARSVKPKAGLEKRRTQEKLELERRYLTRRGIEWKIVTEDEIDWQKARNIEWVRQGRDIEQQLKPEQLKKSCEVFEAMYEGTDRPVTQIARELEDQLSLCSGIGIQVFQYLVAARRIELDLEARLNLSGSRRR